VRGVSDQAGELLGRAPGEDDAALRGEEPARVLGEAFREGWEMPPAGVLPQQLGRRVPAGRAAGHPDAPVLEGLQRDERGRAAGCRKRETPG